MVSTIEWASTGPELFWWGGWWIFPIIMSLVTVVVLVTMLYLVFGRGDFRPPWWSDSDRPSGHPKGSETAMEVLKKRYAKGETTRDEFEQVKKDLQS